MKIKKSHFVKAKVHVPVTPGEAIKIVRELQGLTQNRLLSGQKIRFDIYDIIAGDKDDKVKKLLPHYAMCKDVIPFFVDLSEVDFAQDTDAKSPSIDYLEECSHYLTDFSSVTHCIVVFTKSNLVSQMPSETQLDTLVTRAMDAAGVPLEQRKGHVIAPNPVDATANTQWVFERLAGRGPILKQIIEDFKVRAIRKAEGEENPENWEESDRNKLVAFEDLRGDPNLKYADIKAITDWRSTYRHLRNRFTQFFARISGLTSSTKHLNKLVSRANRDITTAPGLN